MTSPPSGSRRSSASTLLFDARTGDVVGPGLGWQDQRTVGQCIALQRSGLRLAPNQSATKLAFLLQAAGDRHSRDLRFATVDSWLVWRLTEGASHVTDATNAGVTGLVDDDATRWDPKVCDALGVEERMLPRIVDSSGALGVATVLPGSPPITALVGDQQASLLGQGCLAAGEAKITFGSGGMLDCCVGEQRPAFTTRGEAGTFPIVARRIDSRNVWGVEGILLAAGTCIEWLRDGLGLISSPAETGELAASVRDSGGVSFVPAFGGLGTPVWDFGARGALIGLDGSTTRAEVVRAVLEGIAHSGADLLEAAEADTGLSISTLRMDGGMSVNGTFVQLVADATRRPVACSALAEATTLGAAFLAGVADGTWSGLDETAGLVAPRAVIEPGRRLDRERWIDARSRSTRTVPFLSAFEF